MRIECGPIHDRRILDFNLPYLPFFKNTGIKKVWLKTNNIIEGNKLGCMVSGGVDSVLMYYLLIEENISTGMKYEITPYTILRRGARNPATNTINWIHKHFNLPSIELNIVGNPYLPEIEQIESGIKDILGKSADYVYIGIMEDRPEHYVNAYNITFRETFHRRYPLLNLQKSHIIDLYSQKNLFDLLKLTTSCNKGQWPACLKCNGCEARFWALDQMGLSNDITLL